MKYGKIPPREQNDLPGGFTSPFSGTLFSFFSLQKTQKIFGSLIQGEKRLLNFTRVRKVVKLILIGF
jgi:hypothetical protein